MENRYEIHCFDDGKKKSESVGCHISASDWIFPYDIQDVYGYGMTKEEALRDLYSQLDMWKREIDHILSALDKCVVTDVDWKGDKI